MMIKASHDIPVIIINGDGQEAMIMPRNKGWLVIAIYN